MMENLQTLLTQVGTIVQLDAQKRKEREARGEFFNVFEILKLETNETRTHSAFLAALLAPNGKHGAGDCFLRAFIYTIDCLKNFEFDTKNAKVKIEEAIGNKNEDATEGGRIDILITSPSYDGKNEKMIIIENKIYAGDQEKQLLRYHNFAQSADHRLLYLTLNGSKASDYSVKDEKGKELTAGEDYFAIGYNTEIIHWLNACIAEAARLPIVRESIIQYQNLIKTLTNQNMETQYRDLIVKIMADNIGSTIAISNQLDACMDYVVKHYVVEPLQDYAKSKNLIFHNNLFNETGSLIRNNESGFYFYKQEWKTSAIWVWKESHALINFYFCISHRKDVMNVAPKAIFAGNADNADNTYPYGWEWLGDYSNWYYAIMEDMAQGKVKDYIIERVEYALKQIKEQNLPMP